MSLRQISPDELKQILADHALWLSDSTKGAKANLRYADLRSADLRYADLRYANLLIFQFQRHTAYFTFDGSLRIGCHVLPIVEWAETFEQIGAYEGYTGQQIKLYGQFIKMCLELFKEQNP